jgi:hypothetical protein
MGISMSAEAQDAAPAASFEELRSRLKLRQGESVQITDENGAKFKAKVTEIRDHAIAITVDGVPRELSESAVREIRHRRRDVWWNGMLIGLGTGLAAGAVMTAVTCENDSECAFYFALAALPITAGIGAGAGAAIDFAIRKHDTVYARPVASINRGLTVSPIFSKDKTGVRVAFSF